MNWKDLTFKDKAQYLCAIALIFSGILIAFFSFFLIHDILSGVLIYIGQAFIAGGSIFGVSIYFNENTKKMKEEINKLLVEEIRDKENNKGR